MCLKSMTLDSGVADSTLYICRFWPLFQSSYLSPACRCTFPRQRNSLQKYRKTINFTLQIVLDIYQDDANPLRCEYTYIQINASYGWGVGVKLQPKTILGINESTGFCWKEKNRAIHRMNCLDESVKSLKKFL